MPKISTVTYSIHQGVKSLHRNRIFSVAAIATMTACLFLFGIFYFLLTNLSHIVKDAQTNVGVTVFFDEGISKERIAEIGTEITGRAEVAYITFISAEEAWEKYKETTLDEKLIESFGDDNPLENSASYEVHLRDVAMQDMLVRFISGLSGVRQVNDSKETADMLVRVNRGMQLLTTVITSILVAVSVFLISTTISTGIAMRKQELSIMRLIGATEFFIRAPFFVEGMLLGILGTVLPLGVLYLLYDKLLDGLTEKLTDMFGKGLNLLDIHYIFVRLTPILFLIGISIGVIGTWMALRRQLKKLSNAL